MQKRFGCGFWTGIIKLRKRINKTLCLSIFRPFIHFAYLVELKFIDEDLKQNFNNYVRFADKLIENVQKINNEEDKLKLMRFGENNEKLLNQRDLLRSQFFSEKLYETFFENCPQGMLQLMIIMQSGVTSYFQYFTICTSILSFSLSAVEMLLLNPTKVSIISNFNLLKRLYHSYMGVYGYRQNGGGARGVAKSTLFYICFKVGGVIWCPAPSIMTMPTPTQNSHLRGL